MTLAEKLLRVKTDIDEVYEAGYNKAIEETADNTIVGTWVFKDEITPLPDMVGHEMVFCDKEGTMYCRITYGTIGPPVYAINYWINDGVGAGYPYVFPAENTYGFTAGWQDEKYKTITVIEEPTDNILIEWLRVNAVKQKAEYQPKTDYSLKTNSKSIVGAINELWEMINSLQGN